MKLTSGWAESKMCSVEVFEFVNITRVGHDAHVRHDSVLQKARKLFHKSALETAPREYISNNARRTSYKYLFTLEQTNIILHSYLSTIKTHSKDQEYAALRTIESILNITLERQYSVVTPKGVFRIDGYHSESNTAYEIDEGYHSLQEKSDLLRENAIFNILGCKFIRVRL